MPMNIVEAEQIVRQELGPDYMVVKLSGWWLIYRRDRAPICCTGEPMQAKSLPRAIAMVKAATAS